METALVVVALIAFIGFRQWLHHDRRRMVHRERLAAIEKGLSLPPLELEIQQRTLNVQRLLLLAGMIWIALGATAMLTLGWMLAVPNETTKELPMGIQFVGLAPIGIGLAHLVVYFVGRKREQP